MIFLLRTSQQKEHTAQLQAQLKATEQLYGKNSPEAVALKAEIQKTSKTYNKEVSKLKDNAKTLSSMYPKKVSFWKKVGRFFKKIGRAIGKVLDFVMPIVKMIPGVGQIAGAVYGGVKAIGKFIKGDWKGGLMGLVDAIPGGGVISGVAGKAVSVAKTAIGAVKGGVSAVKNFAKGNILGGLTSLGGAVGSTGIGNAIKSGASRLLGKVSGAVKGALGPVWNVGKKVFGTAKNVFQAGKNILTGGIGGIFDGVKSLFSGSGVLANVGQSVGKLFGSAFSGVNSLFKRGANFVSNIVGGAKSVFSKATRGVKSFASKLFGGAKSAVSQVTDGLKSVLSKVLGVPSQVAQKLASFLKGLFVKQAAVSPQAPVASPSIPSAPVPQVIPLPTAPSYQSDAAVQNVGHFLANNIDRIAS